MAFLIRLAKQQTLQSKAAQFDVEIRSLKTELQIPGPVQIEWIRGSRRTAAIVDTPRSNGGWFNLECKLSMRATMFFDAASKGDQFQSKSSKLVFKVLCSDGLKPLGEILLDLSGCFTGQPIDLQLSLKSCKDKNAIVDLRIVGQTHNHHNEMPSQCESLVEPTSAIHSEYENDSHQKEVVAEPDKPKAPENSSAPAENYLTQNVSFAFDNEGFGGGVPTLPKLTPKEEFLSIQLDNAKSQLEEALTEIDQLRSKERDMMENERELFQLRHENLQLREELQANKENLMTRLTYKEKFEDSRIECEQLIQNLNETSQNLSKERLRLQSIQRLMIDIGRRIDTDGDCEISIKELDENYKINSEGGCEGVVNELQRLVSRIFQLRCEVKERQSQVERIGYQQQQVVDKWKLLAGKTVRITIDGEVEEIDFGNLRSESRRSSLNLPASKSDFSSESVKRATESSCDVFRLQIQQLKQELELERSQYRKANLPDSDTVSLEHQLLEAKVRLANLAEALTSLEQENKLMKEQLNHSEWYFRFNKSIKNP